MAIGAGAGARVQITGAATSMTAEAMELVSGKTYKVTNQAKAIFDWTQTITIDDGGSPVSASNIETIDYLLGLVTFDSGYTPSGAITVDGNYLPLTEIATAKGVDLELTCAQVDSSTLNTTMKQRTRALIDATGSLSGFDPDLGTTVGGGDSLYDLLTNGTLFVVDINPGVSDSDGNLFRLIALMEEQSGSTDIEGTSMTTFNYALSAQASQESRPVGFSYGAPNA